MIVAVKILSTSDVPAQHAKWVLEEIAKVPVMQKLPQELFDTIAEYGVGDSKASNWGPRRLESG